MFNRCRLLQALKKGLSNAAMCLTPGKGGFPVESPEAQALGDAMFAPGTGHGTGKRGKHRKEKPPTPMAVAPLQLHFADNTGSAGSPRDRL